MQATKPASSAQESYATVVQEGRPLNQATLFGSLLAQKKFIAFHLQELEKEQEREAFQTFFLVCLLYKA